MTEMVQEYKTTNKESRKNKSKSSFLHNLKINHVSPIVTSEEKSYIENALFNIFVKYMDNN